MASVASASGVSKGTITGLIDGLEADGLVQRSACSDDRRVSHVALTDKGQALLQAVLPGHLRRLSELVGVLGREDQQALRELLGRFRAGLLELADGGSEESA